MPTGGQAETGSLFELHSPRYEYRMHQPSQPTNPYGWDQIFPRQGLTTGRRLSTGSFHHAASSRLNAESSCQRAAASN